MTYARHVAGIGSDLPRAWLMQNLWMNIEGWRMILCIDKLVYDFCADEKDIWICKLCSATDGWCRGIAGGKYLRGSYVDHFSKYVLDLWLVQMADTFKKTMDDGRRICGWLSIYRWTLSKLKRIWTNNKWTLSKVKSNSINKQLLKHQELAW